MKFKILFALLIAGSIIKAQTYGYSFDYYAVDSIFLNETIVTSAGAFTQTITNRLFFDDTSKVTQYINELNARHINLDAEAIRLRIEANALEARVDTLRAKRILEGFSIVPATFMDPVKKPGKSEGILPDKKTDATKPKKPPRKKN